VTEVLKFAQIFMGGRNFYNRESGRMIWWVSGQQLMVVAEVEIIATCF